MATIKILCMILYPLGGRGRGGGRERGGRGRGRGREGEREGGGDSLRDDREADRVRQSDMQRQREER